MKKNRMFLVLFIIGFVFVTACKKSTPTKAPLTRAEIMALATWKFSNAKVGGTDVSASLQACQKDNLLRLYKNTVVNTGNIDEGPLKCNASDPQTYDILWQMPDENTLVINSVNVLFAGGSNTFTIISVSESTMVLSQVISVLGTPQTVVVTFIH